jgi:hypothetical protein
MFALLTVANSPILWLAGQKVCEGNMRTTGCWPRAYGIKCMLTGSVYQRWSISQILSIFANSRDEQKAVNMMFLVSLVCRYEFCATFCFVLIMKTCIIQQVTNRVIYTRTEIIRERERERLTREGTAFLRSSPIMSSFGFYSYSNKQVMTGTSLLRNLINKSECVFVCMLKINSLTP